MNAPTLPDCLRPARHRRAWTPEEEATLCRMYPTGGVTACRAVLPGRSDDAIKGKVEKLGLHTSHKPYEPQPIANELEDAEIRRVYQTALRRGAVALLAKRLMRPRWWVCLRARHLGLITPRFKEPDWSEQEDALLVEHCHKSPTQIRRILAKHGFSRTETAIQCRRKRAKLPTDDPDRWNARQLSMLMGVDSKTVYRWIEREGLKASRAGTKRTLAQGDEWRIHARNVRRWIGEHRQLVDLRKVDRVWFLSLIYDT